MFFRYYRLLTFFMAAMLVLSGCSNQSTTPPQTFTESETPFELSTPGEQGIDQASLTRMGADITAGNYGDVHGVVLVRNGYLVFENYFNGYNDQRLNYCYSVSKSITSALIGIAMDEGHLASLDDKLLDYFPEYPSVANNSDNKRAIDLEHVLTMTAGFRWDEWSYPYGDERNDATVLSRSSDWIKFMLDLPMENAPGNAFRYSSGVTMLLSGILRNETGLSAAQFAQQHLFTPLGIEDYRWDVGPGQLSNTGWGLWLRPLDMAKIGYLFLQGGRYGDQQVVSESWVNLSTRRHLQATGSADYGFQWWMPASGSYLGGKVSTNDVYYAAGYGGQYIFVIPHLNMVAVVTAGNFTGNSGAGFSLLGEYILPAVR